MLLVPTLAAVTLSLSEGSAADVRSVPGQGRVSLDLGTSPVADLAVSSRTSTFDIRYSPRFSVFDVTESRDFSVQHVGGMGYSWGTRKLRLSLAVGGTYGQVLFYKAVAPGPTIAPPAAGDNGTGQPPQPAMSGAQVPPTQLLPQASILTTVGVNASLNAYYQFTRRWSGYMGVGFGVGGGVRGSENSLPLSYGPSAGMGVGYLLRKADTLSSSLSGSVAFVPKTRGKFQTITLLEGYTHSFGARTVGSVGAGATYVEARPLARAKKSRAVNAAGQASISQGFKLDGGALLGVTTGATLTSNYDPVLGTVTQALSGGGVIGWARKRLSLGAGVQAGHSLPWDASNAYAVYGANAGVSYQLSKPVQLGASAYWSHQVLPASLELAGVTPDRWGMSLSVTVSAPPIKF